MQHTLQSAKSGGIN